MRRLFLLWLLLISGLAQAANPFETKPDFLPVEKAFVFTSERLDSGETQLFWQIADGYYLYRQRLKFDGLADAQKPELPEGEAHSDEFFGDQQVYRQALELKVPAGVTGKIKVGFQGCADAGLCYPPQTQVVDLGGGGPAVVNGEAPDQALASGLQQRALGWSLLVFFGLGLLLAFTPCSLPMLPILAGLVVGSGAGARRGLALAGSYVISMALVYAAMGVLAALLGANGWQFWRHIGLPVLTPALLGTFVILLANALGAYATVYALTTGNFNVLPIRIAAMVSGDISLDPNMASALAVVLVALMTLVTVVHQLLLKRSYHVSR